jgi:iron-sulfur cluster repair protein YtfE (RIC family)
MRHITVKKVEKTVRVPKEIREEIKKLGIERKVKFMKKELILCPMTKKEQSPIICMTCEYFLRRVRGVIHCKYPE